MPQKSRVTLSKKDIWLGTLSFFIFLAATIYLTFPLIFHFKEFASGEYVIAWIFNWNIHSLLTGNFLHIFEANIYYPFPNSLAYSDFLFPSSLIALVPFLLLHEPIIPSNVTFFSSFVLLGFFTYLLSYSITKNFFASLLSGLLVIFSPITIDKRVHLQMLALEWIPLSLLFFLRFLKTDKFRYLLLSLLFFIIQTYNNFLAGYFLVFSLTLLSGFLSFSNKIMRKKLLVWKNVFAVFAAFLVILPICIPYYTVSKRYDYVRNIRDTIHFAIQPEDLLVTDEHSRMHTFLTFFLKSPSYPPYAEIQPGFVGVVFMLVSIATLIYLFRRKKKHILLAPLVTIALLGFILAFGPALHWARRTIHQPFLLPLPYALLYYVAPGFQGFRNSARFEMLFILTMPIAGAIMLTEFLKNKKLWLQILLYSILIFGTVAEFNFPLKFEYAPTFAQFPPVYTWIRRETALQSVILEVPMYNWDNNPFGNNQEVMREYYSTIHFRKIVGGGSGFSPPPWQQFAIHMFNDFPSPQTIREAKRIGVTFIIVHKKEYDILHSENWTSRGHGVMDGESVLSQMNTSSDLSFVTRFADDYVYKIN